MPSEPARQSSMLSLPIAIVIAGLLIGGGLYFGLSGRGGPAGQGAQAQPSVNIKDVKIAGDPFVGNPNAPVTMAYWSDYQCPFCKQFETIVLPALMEKYVNTGKLKIVFKDFEFLGPDSTADGEYARAIWDLYPSKHFAWRTAMFTTQPQENSLSVADNETRLQSVTASISGIDASKVKAQVAANKAKYDQAMQTDQTEGGSFGIQGTPGFIVGKTLIDGAQPIGVFTAAIDPLLK